MEASADSPSAPASEAKTQPDVKKDPEPKAKRRLKWPLIWTGTFFALLIWYLVSDRLTPFTTNARVVSYVVPIVAEVPGYVTEIHAKKNTYVKKGDPLLQIDPSRYALAEQSARAQLELARSNIREKKASVEAAEASVRNAELAHGAIGELLERLTEAGQSGAVAQINVSTTRAEHARAKAQVDNAKADLKLAKERVGLEGDRNAQIQAALVALEKAELDLKRTTIVAPVDGFIGTLKIDEGHYANPGQPVLSLIASDEVWVEAYLTENNLGNVDKGDAVELVFDVVPGRIFKGKVGSVGGGVSSGKAVDLGNLPIVKPGKGWLRSPQRFPVVVKLELTPDELKKLGVKVYSQADVIIYTGDHTIWNMLGGLWIWAVKYLSYAY